MFFLSLYTTSNQNTTSSDDLQKGPSTVTIDEVNDSISNSTLSLQNGPSTVTIDEINDLINNSTSWLTSYSPQNSVSEHVVELTKRVEALESQPVKDNPLLLSLSDVNITSPSDGDKLIYDGASGKWKNNGVSYLVL